jgi:hypothetical protein
MSPDRRAQEFQKQLAKESAKDFAALREAAPPPPRRWWHTTSEEKFLIFLLVVAVAFALLPGCVSLKTARLMQGEARYLGRIEGISFAAKVCDAAMDEQERQCKITERKLGARIADLKTREFQGIGEIKIKHESWPEPQWDQVPQSDQTGVPGRAWWDNNIFGEIWK